MHVKREAHISKDKVDADNTNVSTPYDTWLNYIGIKYKNIPTCCLEHRRNILAWQNFIIPCCLFVVSFIVSFILFFTMLDEKVLFLGIAVSIIFASMCSLFVGILITFFLHNRKRITEYDELIEEIRWREEHAGEKVNWNLSFKKPCVQLKNKRE